MDNETQAAKINHKIDQLVQQVINSRDAGMTTGRLESRIVELEDQLTALYLYPVAGEVYID